MNRYIVLAAIALVTGVTLAKLPDVVNFSRDVIDDEMESLMDFLGMSVEPERYRPDAYFESLATPYSRVKAFTWKNCGGSVAAVQSLSVTPDPLTFPGTVTIAGKLQINSSVASPLQASLQIKKKAAGIWIPIPCIDNFGSCTYSDLCSILSGVGDCPDPLTKSGLGCQCPFKSGTFDIPQVSFEIDAAAFPSGDYNLTGTLHYQNNYVACLEIILSVSS